MNFPHDISKDDMKAVGFSVALLMCVVPFEISPVPQDLRTRVGQKAINTIGPDNKCINVYASGELLSAHEAELAERYLGTMYDSLSPEVKNYLYLHSCKRTIYGFFSLVLLLLGLGSITFGVATRAYNEAKPEKPEIIGVVIGLALWTVGLIPFGKYAFGEERIAQYIINGGNVPQEIAVEMAQYMVEAQVLFDDMESKGLLMPYDPEAPREPLQLPQKN